MKSRDFCFFMQGLFEVAELKTFDEKQTALIKQHLELVFKHEIGIDGTCDHPRKVMPTSLFGKIKDDILIC